MQLKASSKKMSIYQVLYPELPVTISVETVTKTRSEGDHEPPRKRQVQTAIPVGELSGYRAQATPKGLIT